MYTYAFTNELLKLDLFYLQYKLLFEFSSIMEFIEVAMIGRLCVPDFDKISFIPGKIKFVCFFRGQTSQKLKREMMKKFERAKNWWSVGQSEVAGKVKYFTPEGTTAIIQPSPSPAAIKFKSKEISSLQNAKNERFNLREKWKKRKSQKSRLGKIQISREI